MITAITKMEKKSLSKPDETQSLEKATLDIVTLGGVTFARATLQPGWKWSTCVGPVVHQESCRQAHLLYHISGRVRFRMDDGTEQEYGPGDVALIPPGHNVWVVGDEPAVTVDISGIGDCAKR